ncbi:MAG: cytochrome c3 family protein [Nitrospirota bacterium]
MNKKTPKMIVLNVAILLITMIIFSFRTVYPQDNIPEKEADTCISSKCHTTMGENMFVHSIVAEGQCSVCHGKSPKHKDSPKRYKFERIKKVGKNCYSCHKKYETRKFIHYPVTEGECTSCHSPHGSEYKYILLKEGGSLCFDCHDEYLVSQKYVHGPADSGGCIVCHDPHSADYEKNLRERPPKLCFMCHTEKAKEFAEAKVVHKPAVESCTNCHNPHSAPEQFMLDDKPPALCFKCHKEKKEEVTSAAVQHGALMIGKACLNCHEPHASNIAKRLSMAPMDLCMKCHNKQVRATDGRLLTNMKELLEENKDHHGPIREKNCAGCHNPHGSDEFRILKEKYPSSFYMPFRIDSYKLCFKCHEQTIVQVPKTTTLTSFRNGMDNLHFKHINNPTKGRTCRACHETHASNYPKHIRKSVPYGNWEFDMNYKKTETGGGCLPGCHKRRGYDRVRKVDNK